MLVGDRAGQVRPVEHIAGIAHGQRQRHGLFAVHAVEEHRHGESRDLAIGDGARGHAVDEGGDLTSRQPLAVSLVADDFLRKHQLSSSPSRNTRCRTVASRDPPTGAMSLVSWCESSAPVMPAAKLVMTEQAATRRPRKRARMTSGTVDMPTALAPMMRAMRISAGVSKHGPENHI